MPCNVSVLVVILLVISLYTVNSFRPVSLSTSYVGKSVESSRQFDTKVKSESCLLQSLPNHFSDVPFTIHSKEFTIIAAAAKSLYRVQKQVVQQSPINILISRLSSVLGNLNPMQILGGMYAVFMVGMLATGFLYKSKQLFNFIRGKREEIPQLYECEFCNLEMRPAKGRALQILSRRDFRCAQCGAPGSAFFDTENMGDPRAVARLRRIAKEKRKEQEKYYGRGAVKENDADQDEED